MMKAFLLGVVMILLLPSIGDAHPRWRRHHGYHRYYPPYVYAPYAYRPYPYFYYRPYPYYYGYGPYPYYYGYRYRPYGYWGW